MQVYGIGNWFIYAAEIAKHFDEAIFFVPVEGNRINYENQILPQVLDLTDLNIRLVKLPQYTSTIASIPWLPKIFTIFLKHREDIRYSQALLIRVPSICALVFAEFGHAMGKKVIFSAAGNIETQANPITKGGHLKPLWLLLARTINLLTKFSFRSSLVIAVVELAQKFSKGFPFFPKPLKIINCPDSMFSEKFLYMRGDTCQTMPVKLIRVCQLIPNKGLDILFESIEILIKKGYQLELDIAGIGSPEYQQQLIDLAEKLRISMNVTILGSVRTRTNNGFIPPSRHSCNIILGRRSSPSNPGSLGCPLPLVSTAVGGIPGIVQNEQNGLLVQPGDPKALAEAIEKVIIDKELRKKLIRNGFAFAREHSLEKQAEKVANAIKNYLISPNTDLYHSEKSKNF